MKTLMMKKMRVSLLGIFAVTALLSACQKKNDSQPAPAPVAPIPCAYQGCVGGNGIGGGQVLYSGVTTQNGYSMQQAQFQVSTSGNGQGSIQGTLTISNPQGYYCQQYILPPGVPMTFTSQQQGYIVAGDAFQGYVMLQSPQGQQLQGQVQVIPVRQGLPGLFSIAIQGCGQMEMNF